MSKNSLQTVLDGLRQPVQKMLPYVPGEQPRGGKAIKLNTNENPYPPSPAAVAAIQQAASTSLQRYPDPVGTAFCIQAAETFGVDPDWILCGNGSDDILTILTRSFVGEGEKLRLPFPSYILYRTLADLQGAEFEEVRFNDDFSLPASFAGKSPMLKFAFLPNPNSPSGTVLLPDQVAALADELGCPLLVDEAYADFAERNCVDLVKQNPNIMVSRTMSKAYGLAGLRFGFLIAQPPIIAKLRQVKDSYNCDALSIAGATAALADTAWLANNTKKVKATRLRMTQELRALGFVCPDSQANFVWCTRHDRAVQPLYESLKSDGILVRYMNYEGWGDGIRISVGTDEQIDACLSLLKSYLA